MGMRLKELFLGGIATAGVLWLSAAQAQEVRVDQTQLGAPTIPQAIDQAIALEDYFQDQSLGGDARFLFGLDYGEAAINRSARRLEALYRDLQQQQANDSPILRTRDLTTPYTTSLLSEPDSDGNPVFESVAP